MSVSAAARLLLENADLVPIEPELVQLLHAVPLDELLALLPIERQLLGTCCHNLLRTVLLEAAQQLVVLVEQGLGHRAVPHPRGQHGRGVRHPAARTGHPRAARQPLS